MSDQTIHAFQNMDIVDAQLGNCFSMLSFSWERETNKSGADERIFV